MAEFVDVMKQYNRMFEAHKKGVSIPVEASYETAVKQPEYFEEVVMSWAAEHPVVYPTWGEWLVSQHVVSEHAMQAPLPNMYYPIEDKMHTPIPADLAEKLGLQPKEGTQ